VQVAPPKLGELRPASVTAEVVIDTRTMRPEIKAEWDELRQHDVLFLLSGELGLRRGWLACVRVCKGQELCVLSRRGRGKRGGGGGSKAAAFIPGCACWVAPLQCR